MYEWNEVANVLIEDGAIRCDNRKQAFEICCEDMARLVIGKKCILTGLKITAIRTMYKEGFNWVMTRHF